MGGTARFLGREVLRGTPSPRPASRRAEFRPCAGSTRAARMGGEQRPLLVLGASVGSPAPVAIEFAHAPVLLEESLEWLALDSGSLVVDGTVGGGGHAEAILVRSAPGGRVI